jgi:hypothetical protein
MKRIALIGAIFGTIVAGPVLAQNTSDGRGHDGVEDHGRPGRCITFENANNRVTPPELYRLVGECIRSNKYSDAAALFALAGMDIRFDVSRISDNSVGDTGTVLIMEMFQTIPETAKQNFYTAIRTVSAVQPATDYVCNWVRQVGPPTYYPEYMIMHGMNAVTSGLRGTPLPQALLPVSDPSGRWQTIGRSYLHCPSGVRSASRHDLQAATRYRATIEGALSKAAHEPTLANDVATKVAEMPARSGYSVPFGLAFSADGNQIAVGADEGIAIWDWRQAHLERTLELPKGQNIGLTTNPLTYSPDGKLLAVCGSRGAGDVTARIWNTSDWSVAKDITDPGAGSCSALGFSSDGLTFIDLMDRWGEKGEELIVHEGGTWQKLWGLTVPHLSPVSLAVSPDGRQVTIGGLLLIAPSPAEVADPVKRFQESYFEPHMYLLDLRSRHVVRNIQTSVMGPMTWSSDGSRIAVAGPRYVEMFDARSGKRLVHVELINSTHMNDLFTPDGRYFIESDMNARGTGLGVHIWDVGRQKLLQSMPDNADSIAVSRNGRYLAVGVDGRTTIWQFREGSSIAGIVREPRGEDPGGGQQ